MIHGETGGQRPSKRDQNRHNATGSVHPTKKKTNKKGDKKKRRKFFKPFLTPRHPDGKTAHVTPTPDKSTSEPK
ncbi:hypothetical protein VTH06DRAFT_1220 [Thermothelomyces fergusii]